MISGNVSGDIAETALACFPFQGVIMPWIDKASLLAAAAVALAFAVTLIGAAVVIVGQAMVHQWLVG